jgi:hypothetical protein
MVLGFQSLIVVDSQALKARARRTEAPGTPVRPLLWAQLAILIRVGFGPHIVNVRSREMPARTVPG